MAYQITYTEKTNPAKHPLKVNDKNLNVQTDLTFVGKNYDGYAASIAENFLHLLENFASPDFNTNGRPVEGQLWYDNSTGNELLKVFDGSAWNPVGAIKKSPTRPPVGSSNTGDLWLDTSNLQLFVLSGSTWLLIGPQFSTGLKSGPIVEVLDDIEQTSHRVVSFYVDNVRVLLISQTTFTPNPQLVGFDSIAKGLNVAYGTDNLSDYGIIGTAAKAKALVVNGTRVDANNFLRNDVAGLTLNPFSVKHDSGITVGNDLGFSIYTDTNTYSATLKSSTLDQNIAITTSSSNSTGIRLFVSADGRIGVGNTNPQYTFDVSGTARITDSLTVDGSVDITSSVTVADTLSSHSLITASLIVNNNDANSLPIAGSVITPGYTTVASDPIYQPLYDIGSPDSKFRNVYANEFVGNFSGTISGTVYGDVEGSASRLLNAQDFTITGDVYTPTTVSFDGQNSVVLTAYINDTFITVKPSVTDVSDTDVLLLYRPGDATNKLKRTTIESLRTNIPTIMVGGIILFAGSIIPHRYKRCDGQEILTSTYSELFSVIGYTYKAQLALTDSVNKFALPNIASPVPGSSYIIFTGVM